MVHFFQLISVSLLYGTHLGSASVTTIDFGNNSENISLKLPGELRGTPTVESGNAVAESLTSRDKSNRTFLRKIFSEAVKKTSDNVALSPVGIYFISSMTTRLLKGDLYEAWSRVAKRTKLETLNSRLVADPLVGSKSVIAGSYADMVPADFTMDNFQVFDSVNVSAIEKFLETDVSEIRGALGAAVHVLDFRGAWETDFSLRQRVTFSDGLDYMFMKARILNVPSYNNAQLEMITLPFRGGARSGNSVVIDFIKSKDTSNFELDLEDHPTWLLNAEVVASHTDVSIPKIDIEFSQFLNLSDEKNVDYLQKVAVKWDEDGVTAQAVTMRVGRSAFSRSPSFVADRPFYFIIRKGNLWLFTGYVGAIDKDLEITSDLNPLL
mmetsp:Transcript_44969/g.88012  ORF Transcript_44969/g.88012 Transcript_44969/m.88012 type:complete len:380 (+) Transcript_44969:159-1298(+)|eukprot:CAMPEP_0194305002 /NCGR_PEP_ID=MMETSP0171-20130528/2541_1 /TAXON_ID=218684 /ORGANISM="Corethron pennatum, Strain L29A3" /LENGTH=379 /DNA_ID=CAMNT_0039056395 /DNA_START=145 /DNA_END=1287 /DNA_ORIENTATION=+